VKWYKPNKNETETDLQINRKKYDLERKTKSADLVCCNGLFYQMVKKTAVDVTRCNEYDHIKIGSNYRKDANITFRSAFVHLHSFLHYFIEMAAAVATSVSFRFVFFLHIFCGLLILKQTPILIKGGTVVNADRSFFADVLCENGVITRVGDSISCPGARVIDATGKFVMPGLSCFFY
jgi:adenine deaminase